MKILVMGLPGSGKTELSKRLSSHFLIPHHNADTYRELNDDWDFSELGRLRQAGRMAKQWGILDFVCPLGDMRWLVRPDYIIWMDTIEESRYEDTNAIFEPPVWYNLRIRTWTGADQLLNCLEDFNPGIKGIQSFLDELTIKQDR